jgi:uncharacterized damage-inducible protein DinB
MPPTKSELLEALHSSGSEVLEQLAALPPEEFSKGRYENGWNAREILAHVASVEWTYPRLIEIANQEPSPAPDSPPPTKKAKGGILSYNDRQVAKRAEAAVEELLAEFERNRRTTIEAVEATDDETLSKEVTSSGGFTGPLSQVLHWVAVDHVRTHLNDIVNA